jgi:hypothetical protein
VAASQSERVQHLTEETTVLIGRDGRIFAAMLKRKHVPMLDKESSGAVKQENEGV